MIPAIIFSRNRAMQLDALLRSMEVFAPGKFGPVMCLCRADSKDLLKSYSALWENHDGGGKVFIMRESEFSLDLSAQLRWLAQSGTLVCLFTDDDIFFDSRPIPPDLANTELCYSLRLSRNITHCYPLDRPQKEGEHDFLYQWSLDGHIYRAEDLWEATQKCGPFHSPNTWEAALNRLPRDPRGIAYAEHSCVVNIPHNIVQNDYANRHAGGSSEELNTRFLAGERIDFLAMDFSDVRGCHQEIPYVFKKP